MHKRTAPLLLVAAALGCSNSAGGGNIEPDPAGPGASGSSSSGTSSGGATGDGGGSPGRTQNFVSRLAWTYLQGEFDSGDQEHVGDIEVPAKRLVGCALDAPTLGESVLYIERSNLDTPEIPDRQLVVAFELLESERLDVFGKGRVHRPLQPTAWVGRCTVGTLMTPPGEVEELLECELSMALNGGTLSITSPIMPASCAAASPDAEAIKSELSARSEYVRWSDVLRLGDDTTVWDPPSASGADTYPHYELLRRTEMPPLPGEQ